MNKTYENIIMAIKNTTIWPEHLKSGLLAWSIGEQGRGVGVLANKVRNYYSLHHRPDIADKYPRYYEYQGPSENLSKYMTFSSAEECLQGLYDFIHRQIYYTKGDVDKNMKTFEGLLRFLTEGTPSFCPRKDYVSYIMGLVPEAEAELRKVGWKPEEVVVEPAEYKIMNGLLYLGKDPIIFFETPNKNKWVRNIPKSIILHYTASLGMKGIINWFQNPRSRVSIHFIISQTGTIVQMVPLHVAAWHSGSYLYNPASIGIELEGLGCSKIRIGNNVVFPMWGGPKLVPVSECVYAAHPKEPRIFRWWPKLTDAQYDTLNVLIPVLRGEYGALGLLEHWEIMGGKLDVGPALVRSRLGM